MWGVLVCAVKFKKVAWTKLPSFFLPTNNSQESQTGCRRRSSFQRYKLIARFSDAQVDLVDSVETGLDH
jgi:hypothetical protein